MGSGRGRETLPRETSSLPISLTYSETYNFAYKVARKQQQNGIDAGSVGEWVNGEWTCSLALLLFTTSTIIIRCAGKGQLHYCTI